jgi:hypothetical protein
MRDQRPPTKPPRTSSDSGGGRPQPILAVEVTEVMIERGARELIVRDSQERMRNVYGNVSLESARRMVEAVLVEALRLDRD